MRNLLLLACLALAGCGDLQCPANSYEQRSAAALERIATAAEDRVEAEVQTFARTYVLLERIASALEARESK